jgi:hypothetical protein
MTKRKKTERKKKEKETVCINDRTPTTTWLLKTPQPPTSPQPTYRAQLAHLTFKYKSSPLRVGVSSGNHPGVIGTGGDP